MSIETFPETHAGSIETLNRDAIKKALDYLSTLERPITYHTYLAMAQYLGVFPNAAADEFNRLGYAYRSDMTIVFLDEIPKQQWAS